ncbi:MAG: OmpA family protein [Gammaproteobacteria bacterium]|nr:OmpA family protein [Gammaproteobacteria bacterium]
MTIISTLAGAMLIMVATIGVAATDSEGSGKSYPDGHGGEVFFPRGDESFADDVVTFKVGDPGPGEENADPQQVLGIPDYAPDQGGFVTLGCAGELVLRFTDNRLIDIPGPDLYVFEIGPDVEPTALAVSADGDTWTRVGTISGGKAEIDLAPYGAGDETFRYVKLVDLKQACSSRTPGADVDAVGAIGSASKIALDSAVLFDSGEHRLKQGAFAALDEVIEQINDPASSDVEVAGHTDSVGSETSNLELSRNRARAVADYLIESGNFADDAIVTRAFGERQPIASNESAEGRQRNRRVELTVRTTRAGESAGTKKVEILGVWAGHSGASADRVVELRREDGAIRGDYDFEGSSLIGDFTDATTFEGYWVKDRSGRKCETEKDGRRYWGQIRLEFESSDRDEFTGYWRYCGDNDEDDWSSQGWSSIQRIL